MTQGLPARRAVALGTGVLGSGLLRHALRRPHGSRSFYAWSGAVAVTWLVGARATAAPTLGRTRPPVRSLGVPAAIGAGAFGALYAACLVARRVPALDRAASSVLAHADRGSSAAVLATTLANGLGEEVFFRGAVYALAPEGSRTAVSCLAYVASTAATGNPTLVLAAGYMGTLFTLQRRATGGILAPAVTHTVWSVLALRFLPPLFRRAPRPGRTVS